ncbi:LIVCS family branched-chain amino acid:cation transporter [Geomicrobium halophilum]|uniref:Branched-chain amino acid transport system carrier protein n=1 Tax=Geomicrobium halophilum TaxID=549000 RepID=A0A841PVP0_9BACL|nr:branched-chain amino acid transport system II carrier protein [Geomicrobium halophilum]MBB6448273.1 LIVCS family branched-chain amino acid:cation transporter [Geomicrobium halophilum]
MQSQRNSSREIIFIGLMLFSLFFGAGNLIFPPLLGQEAGTNFWPAIIGFLISGVGLPLLGVLAIVYTAKEEPEAISRRVHPRFATAFTSLTFLTIGPLFAVPRTGTVSFEIGIIPFLPDGDVKNLSLFIFTVLYFAIVYWLALNPGKFVDRIGKVITPALLFVIFILLVRTVSGPLGTYSSPTNDYEQWALFNGFQEGYLTMDTIAAFVFGIIVVQAIKSQGVQEQRLIQSVSLKASAIAGVLLVVIYTGLAFLGATSTSAIGVQDNGGSILSLVAGEYFGIYGNIILSISIIFACIPTAVGLISSCANYFQSWFPSISYRLFVLFFTLLSAGIANMGLDQLILFSMPVLTFIYPIIIVLILLSFTDRWFQGKEEVYRWSVLLTAIVSTSDGLREAGIELAIFDYLPFAAINLGWVVPALVGVAIGLLHGTFKK